MIIISLLQSNFCSSTIFSLRTHHKSCSNALNTYITTLINCLKQDNMLSYNEKRKFLLKIKNSFLKIQSVLHQRMFKSDSTQRESKIFMINQTILLHYKHCCLSE